MPWNEKDYPLSMKNLDKDVRNKAIEIANALIDEGYDEGRAIPIAIDQAKAYIANHREDSFVYEVKPHKDGWQVIGKGNERASKLTDTKEEAIQTARAYMEDQVGRLKVYNKEGELQE